MADIDSFDRPSWEILCWLSEGSLKNTTELSYFKQYRSLHSAYSDIKTQLRMYNSIVSDMESRVKKVNRDGVKDADEITTSCIRYICHLQRKIDEESTNLLAYENELAKLEESKPIQDILNRERRDGEEIEMTFAKFTLEKKIHTQQTVVKRFSFFKKLQNVFHKKDTQPTTDVEEIEIDDEALKDLIQYFKNN